MCWIRKRTQSKTTYQLFGGMVIIPVVVGGNHQRQQHVEAKPQAKEFVTLELPHCFGSWFDVRNNKGGDP